MDSGHWSSSLGGVLQGPLLGLLDGSLLVLLPVVSDLLVQGVVQVWQRHQGLDGEQHGSNLQSWRPLVLQDVQADSAELVDVGVVDLRSEEHLWWDHWVLLWQEELAVKETALVWGLGRTSNLDIEMSVVFLIWLSVDADNWVLGQSLGFL
jgi:hypothetical protein